MNVEILSIEGDTIRFVLEGVDIAFANALRRTMIADVPCMVIDDLFIFDNSSPVPDEILSHRICLVPLKTDLDSYVLPEQCKCGSDLGCSQCRVVLTLDVKAETGNRTVTSGDLVSENPNVVPSSPSIPLAKIAPGQAIRLEAYARLGTGKVHAKWQPVSSAIYQHVAEIDVNGRACTVCGKCVEACPRGVFSLEGGKLKVVDIYTCTICGECAKACTEKNALNQAVKSDAFLFTVESTGCLPPERIVTEAARIIVAKLDEFSGKIERGETNDEITEFEVAEQAARGLYSVGSGEFEEEEEDEEPEA